MNGCGSEESRLKRVPKVQGAILFALISQAKGQSFMQITAFGPLFVCNLEPNHGNMVWLFLSEKRKGLFINGRICAVS